MWEQWLRICRVYSRVCGIGLMIVGPLFAISSLLFLGNFFGPLIIFGLVIMGIGFVMYITNRE